MVEHTWTCRTINFGDPVTPAPQRIAFPSQRADWTPTMRLGYPIETVFAEKISTAVSLGEANTRVRDYVDLYTLTGRHELSYEVVRAALEATANHRDVQLVTSSARSVVVSGQTEITYPPNSKRSSSRSKHSSTRW